MKGKIQVDLPNVEKTAANSTAVRFRVLPGIGRREVGLHTAIQGNPIVVVKDASISNALALAQLANFAFNLGKAHARKTKL